MVCAQCGAVLEGDSRFCSKCGAPVVMRAGSPPSGVAPPFAGGAGYGGGMAYGAMVEGSRVRRNLQTLGVLWCCFAAYRVLSGLVGLIFFRAFVLRDGFGWGWPFPSHLTAGAPWLANLVPVIAAATVVSAALAAFVGWSLLTRQPWGRVLAMVAACLALIKFPLGTVLGVYTLVVLSRRGAAEEWDSLSGRVI